ncbi:hypothetical protein DK254_24105 [Pseudomonas sp. RW407]|nr:hypothetical protein DK254_24105 [Pseudomonas sp. RW407]
MHASLQDRGEPASAQSALHVPTGDSSPWAAPGHTLPRPADHTLIGHRSQMPFATRSIDASEGH